MALFEKYPPHIRKKIALISTASVGILLLGILLVVYSSKDGEKDSENSDSPSQISQFYTTLLDNAQSYFGK